jgi:hypothetical protein
MNSRNLGVMAGIWTRGASMIAAYYVKHEPEFTGAKCATWLRELLQ